MRWLGWTLASPILWAALFSAVYALHGIGCAQGWTVVATPLGPLHQVAMVILWLGGLILHALILLRLRGGGAARTDRLPRMGAWIGFVASLVTLSPLVLISTCG